MNDYFKIKKDNYAYFVALLIMHFLYVLPIIIANRYYRDDLSRALTGMKGWTGDGRPLTELIIVTLGGGKIAADAAPWYLILAIIILSYALVLYFQNNDLIQEKEFGLLTCVSLFLFSTNTFLIYAFSYKFDVITMILSLVMLLVLFSIPFKNSWQGLAVSVAVGLVLFMVYQTSVGMTYGLFAITVFLWLLGKKDVCDIKKDAVLTVGISISALIYKFGLASLFIEQSGENWRYGASQLVGVTGKNPIVQIIENISSMLYYIVMSYGQSIVKWVAAVIVILVSIIHIIVCAGVLKKNRGFVKFLFCLVMPIAILILNILPIAFLSDAGQKGRLFIPLCDLFMFIGIEVLCISEDEKFAKKVSCVMMAVFILWSFSFIYIYGNASRSQKEYETYLVESMLKDINEVIAEKVDETSSLDYIQLTVVGQTPRSPETHMLTTVYPTLNELVPVYIGNGSWIKGAWISRFSDKQIMFCDKSENEIAEVVADETTCARTNLIYNVYWADDIVYVIYN